MQTSRHSCASCCVGHSIADLCERRAVDPVVGQHNCVRPAGHTREQPRHPNAGVLPGKGEQRATLRGALEGDPRPASDFALQPDEVVDPHERADRELVAVEYVDNEVAAGAGGCAVRAIVLVVRLVAFQPAQVDSSSLHGIGDASPIRAQVYRTSDVADGYADDAPDHQAADEGQQSGLSHDERGDEVQARWPR